MIHGRSVRVGKARVLALNGRRLAFVLGFLAFAAGIVQLLLGASAEVLAIALVAVATGLFGFIALGPYNISSWVALFYALGNVLIALYAKTLLGQRLDSYLYAPVDSFIALAVTSTGLLAALVVVGRIRVGRPLFVGIADSDFLGYLSWASFALGMLFWLLNRWFQDPSGTGFGGIALFRNLLLMAVIGRTAMLLERTRNRRTLDGSSLFILVVSVFVGLVDNEKTAAALPVLSYFATLVFYRGGITLRALLAILAGGLLFAGAVAPMVHALRGFGQHELSVAERTELVTSTAAKLLEQPQELANFARIAAGQFEHSHYHYFGENGVGQVVLGRYASVQQIDPVIAAVDRQGTRGGAAIWPALARLVPSFFYPDKPEDTESYTTLVYYHLVDPRSGKFPTLPLAGQAYAAYGVGGLLIVPFFTFLGFLLLLKKLGSQLNRNVYAIFFLCDFVIVYVSQGDFGQYAGATFRAFPLFALVFWLLAFCYRFRIRHRHGFLRTVAEPVVSRSTAQDKT